MCKFTISFIKVDYSQVQFKVKNIIKSFYFMVPFDSSPFPGVPLKEPSSMIYDEAKQFLSLIFFVFLSLCSSVLNYVGISCDEFI